MRKRTALYSLLYFLVIQCMVSPCAFSSENVEPIPWKLTIAIPKSNDEQLLKLCSLNHFHVVLTNKSDISQRVWKQTNSWGYSILSFIVIDKNGKEYAIKKKPRSWRKNFPGFMTIKPGESHVFDVSFLSEFWDFPQTICDLKRFKIQTTINIPKDQQTSEYNVWMGKVKSAIYEFKAL